ncbi:MAG: MiaB/RimO family radical SAM methylthiotransferase [Candidatus Gracilibacteria bacterium]
MKKYFIQTFGCAMNLADSEKINMLLTQSGFLKVSSWETADLIILNTCSVRKKGEDRVFGIIKDIIKARMGNMKENKKSLPIIGITGCMVRKTGLNEKYLPEKKERNRAKKIELLEDENSIFNNDDKLFPRLKELDFTLRIEEIKYLSFILSHIFKEKIGQEDKFDDYLKAKQLRDNPVLASIVVQTGCDNFCTYCIVPYTRGKEFSRPKEDILNDCKESIKNGAKEITLLGQNVNSYGKQFIDNKFWNEEKSKWNGSIGKSPFRELLDEINKTDGLDRIRFTSSNPHDMTRDILDAHFELDKMCNYLHFALQSGNDEILKKMNRKHTYEDFKNQVQYLRSKDPYFSISIDIIVGFSGETEEMFLDTLKAFEELEFDFAYIARYSVRPGTIASKIYPDDVPDSVKAERWHKLNNALMISLTKRNKLMIGREEYLLIYGEKDGQFFGRTRNFKEVFVEKQSDFKIGDLVKVKITKLDRWVLKGEII